MLGKTFGPARIGLSFIFITTLLIAIVNKFGRNFWHLMVNGIYIGRRDRVYCNKNYRKIGIGFSENIQGIFIFGYLIKLVHCLSSFLLLLLIS